MIALVETRLEEIKKLCTKYRVRRLEIFGSAADGTFDLAESDVDFLVTFQPGTDLGPWLSAYQELKSGLAAIVGREVDLVMAKALKNPHFIMRVNRSRLLIYEG